MDGSFGQASKSTYISPITIPCSTTFQVMARVSHNINMLSGLEETPSIGGSWFSPQKRRGMNEVSLICLVHGGFSAIPGFPVAKTETTSPRKLSLMVLWGIISLSSEFFVFLGNWTFTLWFWSLPETGRFLRMMTRAGSSLPCPASYTMGCTQQALSKCPTNAHMDDSEQSGRRDKVS